MTIIIIIINSLLNLKYPTLFKGMEEWSAYNVKVLSMVLILDGSSETKNNHWYSICVRRSILFRDVTNLSIFL